MNDILNVHDEENVTEIESRPKVPAVCTSFSFDAVRARARVCVCVWGGGVGFGVLPWKARLTPSLFVISHLIAGSALAQW